MAPLLPSGLQDTLTPAALHDRFITNGLLDRFALFGYEQVNPPLLEFETSLLANKGEAHQNNSFRVMDNISHRMMAIRADITPQIERIALQKLEAEIAELPLRLCYAGQVLRVQPANMGGKRQLRQAGLELIGKQVQPLEVLMATIEALQNLGLQQIVVSLSYGGILQDLLQDSHDDASIIKAIYHKDLGALPPHTPNRNAIIALLEHDIATAQKHLPPLLAAKLNEVLELMANAKQYCAQGVEIYADILDVAAFPYHQGVCFTLLDKTSRSEIGRGGCYRLNCYQLSDEYYGCGATLYVDNLLGTKLNYPPQRDIKYVGDAEFFTQGKQWRNDGFVTINKSTF
jgi:ATP phosphoribosyltransferase regulatory subunit